MVDLKHHRQLVKILSKQPFLLTPECINISAIATGLSQPSYKLVCNEKCYFAKQVTPSSNEVAANTLAAKQAIAPSILYADQHWLITSYIDVPLLSQLSMSVMDKIRNTLALLVKLHRTPVPEQITTLSALSPTQVINSLLAEIKDTNYQQRFFHVSQLMLKKLNACYEKETYRDSLVLCHGDANFSNILHSSNNSQQCFLIDYECSYLAPIAYDIAMFIGVNNLIQVLSVSDIIGLYLQAFNQERVVNNEKNLHMEVEIPEIMVTCYLRFSLLINAIWYFSKFEQTKDMHFEHLMNVQISQLSDLSPEMKIILDKMR